MINGDGCNDNCEVEENWFCRHDTPLIKPTALPPVPTPASPRNPDDCWYTLRYRPKIKNSYKRSNGFIALHLNDTVVSNGQAFTSYDIELTLTNLENGKDIDFSWEAGFASEDIIYFKITPNEVIYGGKESTLKANFKDKIYIYDFLRFLDDEYSTEILENPTNLRIGKILGILFHVVFGILFIGL